MKITPLVQSLTAVSLALGTINALAAPYQVTGSMDAQIKVLLPAAQARETGLRTNAQQEVTKHIKLMKIKLAPSQEKAIIAHVRGLALHKLGGGLTHPTANAASRGLLTKKELGMGNVPVLDQGWHGSCVTFAVTAALDAALNKGNIISPTCSLALGKTLSEYGFTPSGWDGSWGGAVLEQYMRFGYVDINGQRQRGCGGLTEYPLNDETNTGNAMPLNEYYEMSHNLSRRVEWEPIAATIHSDDSTPIDHNAILGQIKRAINENHRVTFAIYVDPFVDSRNPGATGKTVTRDDTWVLSKQIRDDVLTRLNEFGGHEMIITGYDDEATVTDEDGFKHQGVFTLRNSWGPRAGNQGTFYMSYDYAQYLLMDAERIIA